MEIGKFLYLLPFSDDTHFKVGVSRNNLSRVLKHNGTYSIKKNNSIIVTAQKQSIIRALEMEILSILDKPDSKYISEDGHTEIRHMQDFNVALDIIKGKPEKLGLQIIPLNELLKLTNKEKPKIVSVKAYIKDVDSYIKNLEVWVEDIKFLIGSAITCKSDYFGGYVLEIPNGDIDFQRYSFYFDTIDSGYTIGLMSITRPKDVTIPMELHLDLNVYDDFDDTLKKELTMLRTLIQKRIYDSN